MSQRGGLGGAVEAATRTERVDLGAPTVGSVLGMLMPGVSSSSRRWAGELPQMRGDGTASGAASLASIGTSPGAASLASTCAGAST